MSIMRKSVKIYSMNYEAPVHVLCKAEVVHTSLLKVIMCYRSVTSCVLEV